MEFSTNKLIQVLAVLESNTFDQKSKDTINGAMMTDLVNIAIKNPIEYTCILAKGFEDLEKEFDSKRKALHNLNGDVIIELVRGGHYKHP